MNIKKTEEILSRYEDKIDLEKLYDWIENLSTFKNNPESDELQMFLKTKEEIITELTNFGLDKKDAIELEKALQMSKDTVYEESNDFDSVLDAFEKSLDDLLAEFDNECGDWGQDTHGQENNDSEENEEKN